MTRPDERPDMSPVDGNEPPPLTPQSGSPGTAEIGQSSTGITFETQLGELQRIVASLERGDLGLDESLAQFEQGVSLLRRCQQLLTGAEQRIEQLTGFTADGEPITRPFDAAATFTERPTSTNAATLEADESNPKPKRARRTTKPNPGSSSTPDSSDDPPRLF